MVVECKNYVEDPGNPELDQLLGRFARLGGRVGILACRKFADKAKFIERCNEAAKGDQGFVILLDDDDLRKLVGARVKDDSSRFKEILLDRFHELID